MFLTYKIKTSFRKLSFALLSQSTRTGYNGIHSSPVQAIELKYKVIKLFLAFLFSCFSSVFSKPRGLLEPLFSPFFHFPDNLVPRFLCLVLLLFRICELLPCRTVFRNRNIFSLEELSVHFASLF